jgi:hypothetical protein
MQSRKVTRLQTQWGDKPCDHPSFDKEYYLGSQTGDFICKQCGKEFSRQEYEEIVKNTRSVKAKED